MNFSFLKTDNVNADLIIKRTIFSKSALPPQIDQVTIDTKADNVNAFKVKAQTPLGFVHNKIAVGVMDLGTTEPANFFTTQF